MGKSSKITQIFVCGRVPWLYQYWPGGFMLFVVLCPGTPEGSTGSGSGFKASQKTGNRLKSHLTDWEKPGIEPGTPGLQDIGLSPTPRRPLKITQILNLRNLDHKSCSMSLNYFKTTLSLKGQLSNK